MPALAGVVAGEHPALRAWRALVPDAPGPNEIHVLRERAKSAVYRLHGAGPGGTSIVAKHCRTDAGRVECRVHEEILARLPLTTPRCYGHVTEGDGSRWLFLEHVDGARFAPAVAEDRALVAHWLAQLHGGAATIAAVEELPDRGPAHHRGQLRVVRASLLAAADAAHDAAERALLDDVVAECARVEAHWDEVETWCAEMPRTLVHGDFRPKNVLIRDRGEGRGRELVALDWETAGWGVPAADVASIRGGPGETGALAEYAAIARTRWPEATMGSLARMVDVGRLFRRIAALAWCSVSLRERWERSILAMRVHRDELGALLAEERW